MLARIHRTAGSIGRAAAVGWLFLAWGNVLALSPALGAEVEIDGQAAVLLETRSGKILWQRNKDLSLEPASTTKILTALIVLEHAKLEDLVTVPAEAAAASGSTVRLQKGEQVAVEQLLYAMLLRSANDAAITLAAHIGGTVGKFAGMMNDKARSLGALQSSFRNPTGLPQKGHVTTARDLAVITRAALENQDFRRIVAAKNQTWKSAKWQGTLKNSNILLNSYEGAVGVKTGHTREAGFCLVAAAARGDEFLVAVILNSTKKSGWRDAKTLLDHGFDNFTAMSLIEPGDTILTSKVDGRKITIAAAESAHYVGPEIDSDPPQMQIALDELELPIAKGEKVGEVIFSNDEKELARVDLISKIAVATRLDTTWVLPAAGGLLLVLLLLLLVKRSRRRNRHIFGSRGSRLRF
ncbi:MAG: D-alanyl-D-alanine carboxypeptidase [Deltaproteobacteria bacterium]|nr:D-alanyl-D-alanine carboxypeptidase [Deltaproteobacteria bacterium]